LVFCKNCGSEISSDSVYCNICGAKQELVTVPVAAPPTIPTPEARKRRFPIGRVALAIVLIAVIVVFMTVKWVPIVHSYMSTEEFPYSYSYKVPQMNEKEMSRELFSESNIKLPTFSFYRTDWSQDFRNIRLEVGWSVVVEITGLSQWCHVGIYQDFGSKNGIFSTSSSGHGTFIVPEAGYYYLSVSNFDPDASHTVSSVKLTAHWIEVTKTEIEITKTATATFQVTRYNVTYISPLELLVPQLYGK